MDSQQVCLHAAVEAQAARTPDAIAVTDGSAELTYAELMDRADEWAGALAARGVTVEDTVAVQLDRSVDLMCALLGILRVGAAYVPIEPGTPAARVRQVIDGARARVCLADDGAATGPAADGVDIVVASRVAGSAVPATWPVVDPANLCAVYFTSGSTGRPKGVACTHEGWANRMAWMQRHHRLEPGEAVLHKTTLTFDDAAVELFWPLRYGGRVVMLPPGEHRDPRAIIEAVVAHEIVHLNVVPSMLDLLLAELTEDDTARLPALRTVLSSGEALRPELVARFFARFGDAVALDNTWGATEASIDSTCRDCTPADGAATTGAVSIGRPIDGAEVLVLDPALEDVPDGEHGDLYIGGIGVARGYLGDQSRTAAAFVPHPWRPGERIYRTGDRGRWTADGMLEFLDRRDRQVKIRGVRIELGEVEAVLRAYPGVLDVAATAWQATPNDKRIACFAVVSDRSEATPTRLRAYATDHLPGYAVPASITVLDRLPRLPSGKLDWQALPTPEVAEQAEYVAARTPTEEAVARIWGSVLGVARVGATDEFFALGGHSLLVVRATAQMVRAFGIQIPISLIFEKSTVELAATWIEERVLQEVAALTDDDALRMAPS